MGVETEPLALEVGQRLIAVGTQLLADRSRVFEVLAIVDAAGDHHLQDPFLVRDVVKGAHHSRRDGDDVEALEHDRAGAVVVVGDLEAALEDGEGLVGGDVRVQRRARPRGAHGVGDRHAAGAGDRGVRGDLGVGAGLGADH